MVAAGSSEKDMLAIMGPANTSFTTCRPTRSFTTRLAHRRLCHAACAAQPEVVKEVLSRRRLAASAPSAPPWSRGAGPPLRVRLLLRPLRPLPPQPTHGPMAPLPERHVLLGVAGGEAWTGLLPEWRSTCPLRNGEHARLEMTQLRMEWRGSKRVKEKRGEEYMIG